MSLTLGPIASRRCQNCARIARVRVRAFSKLSVGHRSLPTPPLHRPFRIGIIGSGPAGFYAAARIQELMPDAAIDMYEQLPTPFGLIRYGVAPDHSEVKYCQTRFEEVAQHPSFRFIGNVRVGEELPLRYLKPHYNALLFAYGASQDKTLDIPGEHLQGIYSARAFVGWYNGLPEYADLDVDLKASEDAVVIGNGNVALDIARILLSRTKLDELKKTDITEQAIHAIQTSKIRRVIVVGRRGPMQAPFTIKEIRELTKLPNTSFHLRDPSLVPASKFVSSLPRVEQRKFRLSNLLQESSMQSPESTSTANDWELWSMRSPISFGHSSFDENRLGSITFEKNEYVDMTEVFAPTARVKGTGETELIETSTAFRSIGYKSTALSGIASELGIAFRDGQGIIANDGVGRAMSSTSKSDEPQYVPGCYCAGWVKRGPTGVVASTMQDAFATAEAIVKDWYGNLPFLNQQGGDSAICSGWDGVKIDAGSRLKRPITWQDWKQIDLAESKRGELEGKEREKFRSVEEMLSVLD